jgi:hypothetical protein
VLGTPALAGAPGTSSAGASGASDVVRPGIFSGKTVDETAGRGNATDCGSLTSQSLNGTCVGGGINGQVGAPLPSNRNAVDSGGDAPGQLPARSGDEP